VKPQIKCAFAFFWPKFTSDTFRSFFPSVCEKYDLALSDKPDVVFFSVFGPQFRPHTYQGTGAQMAPGPYVRVFFTGENVEPDMSACEFAISYSVLVDHPNHLRLPLWVYENRQWGYDPERLIKRGAPDWEQLLREKKKFCNFVYRHQVGFRDALFHSLGKYKPVDSAGPHLNNVNNWRVPTMPNRLAGKIDFFRRYKFTLAIENSMWPGYLTEKLVDSMFAGSVPIYVGDPLAKLTFDPASYIDFSCFRTIKEMIEFVREVDNNDDLYIKMLAAPFYRENKMPDYACDSTVLAFFDRIAAAARHHERAYEYGPA
jgi:hypothetical protein